MLILVLVEWGLDEIAPHSPRSPEIEPNHEIKFDIISMTPPPNPRGGGMG